MVITERVNIRAAGNVHLKQNKNLVPPNCSLLFIEHFCSFVVNATFQCVVIVSDLEHLHFYWLCFDD
jgi:hypothetical protein